MYWYEFSPDRLWTENESVKRGHSHFTLEIVAGRASWAGETSDVPKGTEAPPLKFRVVCSPGYPACRPWVQLISPDLGEELIGHEWHRFYDGEICVGRPSAWTPHHMIDEVITKVEDWYFNFVAKRAGLIATFPRTGRAQIK
jgi:hypothetical protein